MRGKTRERWQELCAQAADEQDPERLMELVREINQLLEEKELRLQRQKGSATVDKDCMRKPPPDLGFSPDDSHS